MAHCGWNIIRIPSDENGFVTADAVISHLTDDTALVCVMAVNNETGAVQPVQDIAAALASACNGRRRPKFHVDCVQAAGKIPFSLTAGGMDSAAFSAHKLCGPRGIGLLYLAGDISPFLRGGGQEKNVRSGTENIFGATAFARCLERYFISPQNASAAERLKKQTEWTEQFISSISSLKNCTLIPRIRTDPAANGRYSPWVVQAAFAGIPGQVLVRALSSKGFYISTGSACSARKQSRPILEAMHVSPEERETAVRFSFGPHTTQQAMEDLAGAVQEICGIFSGHATK
jgi:cysteine desulfurase